MKGKVMCTECASKKRWCYPDDVATPEAIERHGCKGFVRIGEKDTVSPGTLSAAGCVRPAKQFIDEHVSADPLDALPSACTRHGHHVIVWHAEGSECPVCASARWYNGCLESFAWYAHEVEALVETMNDAYVTEELTEREINWRWRLHKTIVASSLAESLQQETEEIIEETSEATALRVLRGRLLELQRVFEQAHDAAVRPLTLGEGGGK